MHHKAKILTGLMATICLVGPTFDVAHANPTRLHGAFDVLAIDSDLSIATYDGTATPKSLGSDASMGQESLETSALAVSVGTGAVTVMSQNELSAQISNGAGLSADLGAPAVATGDATLGGQQQQHASGSFNNVVNTGLGNIIQQSNTVTMIFLREGSAEDAAASPVLLRRDAR